MYWASKICVLCRSVTFLSKILPSDISSKHLAYKDVATTGKGYSPSR